MRMFSLHYGTMTISEEPIQVQQYLYWYEHWYMYSYQGTMYL